MINNDEKINISGTYVRNLDGAKIVDGKEVEGGYFTCQNIPSWGTLGQLCFCTGTETTPINKFYKYDGKAWQEHNIPHTTISPTPPAANIGNIGDIWIVVTDDEKTVTETK